MQTSQDDFTFCWEGAHHPDGPWMHLRVLTAVGVEGLSRPYEWTLELVGPPGSDPVFAEDLVGTRASLRIRTGDPNVPFRLVHGLIGEAEELGEIEGGRQYRVVLVPPFAPAGMLRKSLVFYKKSIVDIVTATLSRKSNGAAMTDTQGTVFEAPDDGDQSSYDPWTASFCFRLADDKRAADPKASWYRVQYEEDDVSFVSRLLEEEGIAYHFEFTKKECVMVLTDEDSFRAELPWGTSYGPAVQGCDVDRVRGGSRIRPKGYTLTDFAWQAPNTCLIASGRAGVTPAQVIEHHGNNVWKEFADKLAERREDRLHSERTWLRATSRARALQAGSVFHLEHSETRFSGRVLVVEVRQELKQRGSFAKNHEEPFQAELVCVRCGPGQKDSSRFRPERRTPKPRIHGTQTAIVTGEPGFEEAELNVGTPDFEVGSVRVRFHWDLDVGRHSHEPTSAWVRVSQLFAGADHGALWNPRVGEEVIVAFLDGDPDRPIVVGRVYNGTHRVGMNPTNDPTYSCIKSRTVPEDGSFNLLAFEDFQGKQRLDMEASRDMNVRVHHNQTTTVTRAQSDSAGSISHSSGSTISQDAKTDFDMKAGGDMMLACNGNMTQNAAGNVVVHAGATLKEVSKVHLIEAAGVLSEKTTVHTIAADATLMGRAPTIVLKGAYIGVGASGKLLLTAANVEIRGGKVTVRGGEMNVSGGTVNVTGDGNVNISGAHVKVTGGSIDLNG